MLENTINGIFFLIWTKSLYRYSCMTDFLYSMSGFYISKRMCGRDIRDDIFIYQISNGFLTEWITNVHISFVKRMT